MKIKFIFIALFIIFLTGCQSQEFESLDFSESAKEELRQLLQKPSPDAFDAAYNFHSSIGSQSLVDITFRNAKQGNNQRQEILGNTIGFNLSSYSVTNGGKQVTCALFDNSWECSAGNEACRETSNGKMCYSVEQEGIPPAIKPEQLEKAKVAKTEQKEILGTKVQCYKLLAVEDRVQSLTEVCLNQDGLIMSMGISAGAFEARIEAKSFSTAINPELFVMPEITS